MDRAKKGCKRHVITDACGVPLIVTCTPANVRDDIPFLAILDTLPPVKMPAGCGPPRYKPKSIVGDAGYGFEHIISQVIDRRIRPLLAPRGKPGRPVIHGSGLGTVRYVVERTIAWFASANVTSVPAARGRRSTNSPVASFAPTSCGRSMKGNWPHEKHINRF